MTSAQLKVASYNIHKAVGGDRRRNPGRIIDVLNELDADIIALQEADRRFGKRASAIPPLLLAQNSDYQSVPLDVQTDSMGWHGNAVLVRKSAVIAAHDIAHIPYLEPRGAVMAKIEMGDFTVAVFGMHLDLSGLWRRRQAAAIIKIAGQYAGNLPAVLMGDLNEWSAGSGCLADFAKHYNIADCGRSFHARRPIASLDKIMHCKQLRLTECGVQDTAAARGASDHLPVWASLVWA